VIVPRRRTLLPRFAVAFVAIVASVAAGAVLGVIAYADSYPCRPCDPAPRIADGRAATALEHARERWAAMRLADYAFTVGWECACEEPRDPPVVVVRGGIPVDPPSAVRHVATVERLFALVERAIDERDHVLRVRYDGRTGLPRVIATQPAQIRSTDDISTGVEWSTATVLAGALRRLPHR